MRHIDHATPYAKNTLFDSKVLFTLLINTVY